MENLLIAFSFVKGCGNRGRGGEVWGIGDVWGQVRKLYLNNNKKMIEIKYPQPFYTIFPMKICMPVNKSEL